MNSRQRSRFEHIARKLLKRNHQKQNAETDTDKSPEKHDLGPPLILTKSDNPAAMISTGNSNNNNKEGRERWKFRLEIAGAFVLTIYTFFTMLIWNQTKRSVDINKEALESVQRAFMTMKDLTFQRMSKRPSSGDTVFTWQIEAHFENSGSTPATKVFQFVQADKLASEPRGETFIGSGPPTGYKLSFVGPKAESVAATQDRPDEIMLDHIYVVLNAMGTITGTITGTIGPRRALDPVPVNCVLSAL